VTYEAVQTITFFSINDLHGTAYSDLQSFSRMAKYLYDRNQNQENTIVLASGDMFQGTAFSNYYYGRPLVEIMNHVGFDSFTLGNHEFDWGIDKIAAYRDGISENGEMVFPVLAANIVSKSTGEPFPWAQPYQIVEVSGVRVGIIGLIDDYTIQSISASRVADYAFLDEVETIRNYAYQLNVSEACDLVVVSLHGYYSSTNQEIADLAEEGEAYRIDALFNGHTHSNLASSVARVGTDLPFSQVSGKSTSLIGKITLVYDRISDEVLNFSVESVGSSVLSETDPFIDSLITSYSTNTDFVTFISEPLAYTPYRIGRDLALSTWGSSVIRDYAGVDFGMVNSGGFRVDMESGVITMGDLVEWYPFDNAIKTCEMTGAQLTNFYLKILNNSSYDVVFDDSVSFSGGVLFKNGSPVGLSDWYTVGAVDYIFDKTNYDFLNGRNIQTTDLLMRDLLAEDLRATVGNFSPANGTSYRAPS
jgi:2',3'-cyclic-nucleotide 2'-phosphodiesterase (5'-nucleotidase family)